MIVKVLLNTGIGSVAGSAAPGFFILRRNGLHR